MAKTNRQLKFDKQLLVLTTTEDHSFLKNMADQYGKSMGDIVRDLIQEKKQEQSKSRQLDFA